MKQIQFLTICLSVLTGFSPVLNALDLTGGNAAVIIPDNAPGSTRRAAGDFTEYVEKSSGVKLPITASGKNVRDRIYIGTLDTLKNVPADIRAKLDKSCQPDAFFIRVKGHELWIVGKDRVAELYGTAQFLERELGVRWFKAADAEDSGEYVPERKRIVLKDFDWFREPAFKWRKLDNCHAYWNWIPRNGMIWAVRSGYQIGFPYNIRMPYTQEMADFFYSISSRDSMYLEGGHGTFSSAIPAEKYFKTHPEYFTMLNGKRQLFCGNQTGYYQYCISNPEVQQLVADFILRLAAEYRPKEFRFNFGMTDLSTGWCECPECRKLDGPGSYDHLNISRRFHAVVNRIAQLVRQKNPAVRLSEWAYNTYRELPDCPVLNPPLTVNYCIHGRCYAHLLDDPDCLRNAPRLAELKGWLKRSGDVYTYEYYVATPPFYVPREHQQAHDLRLYKKLGMAGYKEEALFADSRFVQAVYNGQAKPEIIPEIFPSNWQWLYVTGKLLWDPELNVDELLEDVESKYYRQAWPAMKKYHALRRNLWAAAPNCMGYPTGDQRRPMLLNAPGSREKLLAYLAEAQKLAAGDKTVLKRIELDRHYLTEYWIKPNDAVRAQFGKSFSAPRTSGKITIDGDGSDPAWLGAYYTDSFAEAFTEKPARIPDELKTTVGILSDDRNLYFLITAMEPEPDKMKILQTRKDSPVWSDDSMEIFIYPPTAANSYYQIAVNPKGTVFDAVCPGGNGKFNLDVEAAAKIHADRYVIEMKVPVERLGEFRRGNIWRVMFARNRRLTGKHYSINGTAYHNTVAYQPMEIGSPYLRNGSFSDLDKDGKPKFWGGLNNASVVRSGSANQLQLKNGSCYQLLTDPALWQSAKPRKIKVAFRAYGTGWLDVTFLRYSDQPDPQTGKHKRSFLPSYKAKRFFLSGQPQIYTVEYTIAAEEWAGLMFAASDALLADVSVLLDK